MWRPARAMVARAYGKAFTDEELRDVYSAAWTATLSALRTRGDEMTDDELRSYILTAVASHASKEMRRRARKPAGSLDEAQDQVVADGHQLLPEEQAIGNETGGVARDLLASLPPRRRAVMLLRYGWGLRPEEVCAIVSGLSARAYRKEITRGVAELLERLEQIESGEWCRSREPMLRDYVAGTATEETRLQVTEHLRHCRGCSSLAATLRSHLHELGAVGAVVATTDLGSASASLSERLVASWHGVRGAAAEKIDQAAAAVGNIAGTGGLRGSGVAGAGVIAKLASLGGAGKAALACIGVTAAAGACVATGVVPDIPIRNVLPEMRGGEGGVGNDHARPQRTVAATPAVTLGREESPTAPPTDPPSEPEDPVPPEPPSPEPSDPVEQITPVAVSPAQEEFDPMASAPAAAPEPAPAPPQTGGTSSGSGSIASEEFGP